MSATNTISIRLEVTGDAATLSKITNVVNGFKGLKGGLDQAKASMAGGFNTGALTGLNAAIGQTQTQVTTLKTRLQQIGGTLASNASAFGVATASVWGVYNAYDSLVKVEIRAETAMNRVSTMTTTLATLENRLAEARNTGNLSANEMAILEDRITDTKAKLATAQERSADLQGDVNEAWGAFASQVGPQVVAAGASVLQLVTNLRGSMTGVIPSIKNFFGSFMSGTSIMGDTRKQTLLLGQGIGNLPGPMGAATVATKGLSTAMKGLLIGTGVGLAITAIALIAEHFINTAEAAKDSTEDIEDNMTDMEDSVEGSAAGFKTNMVTMEDAIKGLAAATAVETAKITGDLETIKNAAKPPPPLPERLPGMAGGAGTPTIEGPFLTPEQAKGLSDVQAKIKTFKEQLDELYTATVTSGKKSMVELGFGIETLGHVTDETAIKVADFEKKILAAAKSGDLVQVLELMEQRAVFLGETLQSKTTKGIIAVGDAVMETADRFKNYATPAIEDFTATDAKMHEQLLETAKRTTEAATAEQNALAEKERIEKEEIETLAMLTEQTFGVAEATQMAGESNADYKTRMEQLGGITLQQINKEKERTFGLIESAVNLGLAKTRQEELNTAMHEGDNAVAALILSNSTLANVLNDGNRANDLRIDGMVQGREAAVAWYDQMIMQIEADKQFATDQEMIADHFANAIPAGIDLTREQMTLLITTFDDVGKFGLAMGDVLNEVFSASRGALQGLIDAAVEGGDTWKDAWDKLKDIIPKELRTDTKEFITDQAEIGKKIDEAILKIQAYRGAWNDYNKEQKKIAIKDLVEDLQGLENTIDDVTKIDVSKLVDPLIALKKDGMTQEEFNIWQGFFELYNRLQKEGGGIDDHDVRALQEYVKNHTGMKTLGEETGKTWDEMNELEKINAKIASNTKLAETLIIQAQAFQSQLEFVDLLNESLLLRNILMSSGTGGNGFTNIAFDDEDKPEHIERPENIIESEEGIGTMDTDAMIQAQTDLQVALQKTQTAFANLAQQGSLSLLSLAKASSGNAQGISNNLDVVYVSAGHSQEGLANLSNQGTISLARLASASSKAAQGIRNNLNVGYVAAGHLQVGLANLANEGDKSLRKLAASSSTNMNGFVNNLKKGIAAVNSLKSAIAGLKDKTVHVGLTGPGVKFLAQGYHGVVDKPTLMMVGEAGPERVDVSPAVGSKATGLQFENARNVKVEPVGKLDTGPRFERETVHEQTGPRVIQLVTYTYLYPNSDAYRKSVQQVSLDNTGMFPSV